MAEQKSVLSALFPTGSPSRAPRCAAGQFAVLEFQLTVHEDVFHALGKLRRLRIRAHILDGRGIEDGDVRKITFFEQSTAQQALALRRTPAGASAVHTMDRPATSRRHPGKDSSTAVSTRKSDHFHWP